MYNISRPLTFRRGVGCFCVRGTYRSHDAETGKPTLAVLHVFRTNGPAQDHQRDSVVAQETGGLRRRELADRLRSEESRHDRQSLDVSDEHNGEPTAVLKRLFFFFSRRTLKYTRSGDEFIAFKAPPSCGRG